MEPFMILVAVTALEMEAIKAFAENRIQAIKTVREVLGWGRKESYNLVDSWNEGPVVPEDFFCVHPAKALQRLNGKLHDRITELEQEVAETSRRCRDLRELNDEGYRRMEALKRDIHEFEDFLCGTLVRKFSGTYCGRKVRLEDGKFLSLMSVYRFLDRDDD